MTQPQTWSGNQQSFNRCCACLVIGVAIRQGSHILAELHQDRARSNQISSSCTQAVSKHPSGIRRQALTAHTPSSVVWKSCKLKDG